jgi:hypothetical protein
MDMRRVFVIALLAGLLLVSSGTSGQVPYKVSFDCGTISPSSSGKAMTYYDVGHGFRFEFPPDWVGREAGLTAPSDNPCTARLPCPGSIIIDSLLSVSDPKFYISEGARVTGARTVKGHRWTVLAWPDGRRGYYTYLGGVAIEFVASSYGGKNRAPSSSVLGGLDQILSSFSFLDNDRFRVDHQLAALLAGQKLGGLTIKRIIPGKGGFGGAMATIEFLGRLRVRGTVRSETRNSPFSR